MMNSRGPKIEPWGTLDRKKTFDPGLNVSSNTYVVDCEQ